MQRARHEALIIVRKEPTSNNYDKVHVLRKRARKAIPTETFLHDKIVSSKRKHGMSGNPGACDLAEL